MICIRLIKLRAMSHACHLWRKTSSSRDGWYCQHRLYLMNIALQDWVILYFQNSASMGAYVGGLLLLASLLQANSERVIFTTKALIGTYCLHIPSENVQVRKHQHCHWHCMKNPACIKCYRDRRIYSSPAYSSPITHEPPVSHARGNITSRCCMRVVGRYYQLWFKAVKVPK